MRNPPIENVTPSSFSVKWSSEAAQCQPAHVMPADVSVMMGPFGVFFYSGCGCFEDVFTTGFLRPAMGRHGVCVCVGVGSQESGLGSSISRRYPNIYLMIHIYPHTGAAFWVQNVMFSGKKHECAVFIQRYPRRFISRRQGSQ